jgi:microcystin degradation protein MlrC
VVGPAAPGAASHDPHRNVSERLVESVDALVSCRTNPHVDMAACAADRADLLRPVFPLDPEAESTEPDRPAARQGA